MGRIEKLKREAILEANQRVLGIIKEDFEEVSKFIDRAHELEYDADTLEYNIEELEDDFDHHLNTMEDDKDDDYDVDLVDALDYLGQATKAADDAEGDLSMAQYSMEEFLDKQDEEEDEDTPVGKSDMDKHLRDKDGGMGSL